MNSKYQEECKIDDTKKIENNTSIVEKYKNLGTIIISQNIQCKVCYYTTGKGKKSKINYTNICSIKEKPSLALLYIKTHLVSQRHKLM